MKRISRTMYFNFLKAGRTIRIGNAEYALRKGPEVNGFQPPDFRKEEWTVWSFPDRGNWATHSGNYRGNWSPYIPRNLIERYTKPGDLVLDQMMGSGTTMVECRLTGRNGIGVDINTDSAYLAMNRLDFEIPENQHIEEGRINLYTGDARNLNLIKDETVDLIATHPPYCGIIKYSSSDFEHDISRQKLPEFIESMKIIAAESYRVLKKDGHCAILIGDTRNRRHYVPISVGVLGAFLRGGFVLKEDIIKIQHGTKSGREKWNRHSYDFYKIGHEHLYVFRKPRAEEDKDFKFSRKWWD
jgi:DNA modification methylase